MKRVATGVVLLALIAAGAVAVSVGAASSVDARRAAGDDGHDLGRLERRPRADRVQEGGGRVRPEAPRRERQGGRRDRRRQDLRRDPLGQRPGRRQLVHVGERRHLLPVRRLGRPRPAAEAGPHQRQHLPGDVALLHAVQGHPLCPAAARRLDRPLLQQGAVSEGGAHAAAEDAVGAGDVREEADPEEQERVDQDPRLRPEPELLHGRIRQRRIRASSR